VEYLGEASRQAVRECAIPLIRTPRRQVGSVLDDIARQSVSGSVS
jgi:hypothetical protein